MYKGKILDTRVKLLPSIELVQFIAAHRDAITEIPVRVANLLKAAGHDVTPKVELLNDEVTFKQPTIDFELLHKLQTNETSNEIREELALPKSVDKSKHRTNGKGQHTKTDYLYLQDLRWLNQFFAQLRKEKGIDVYLHQFLTKSHLLPPQNEMIKRNPELEARCQKLRAEQENREYKNMTKNVDPVTKHLPEDTIAYQMKVLNKQIIAVLQFILSVVAGFVFGFLGLQLIFQNLEFGFRLLLGIICALIIALAEIYFLAKKLNEYDDVTTVQDTFPNTMQFKKTQ